MSYLADKAREDRWRKKGGVRLHVRITKDADDILTLLCLRYQLERRQVIERLIRGELPGSEVVAQRLGLSEAERLTAQEI